MYFLWKDLFLKLLINVLSAMLNSVHLLTESWLMPSSHRWHWQNENVLSEVVAVGGVNSVGDSLRHFQSVVLNTFEIEQFYRVLSAVWL